MVTNPFDCCIISTVFYPPSLAAIYVHKAKSFPKQLLMQHRSVANRQKLPIVVATGSADSCRSLGCFQRCS